MAMLLNLVVLLPFHICLRALYPYICACVLLSKRGEKKQKTTGACVCVREEYETERERE